MDAATFTPHHDHQLTEVEHFVRDFGVLILAVEDQSGLAVGCIKLRPTDEEAVMVDLPLLGMVPEEAEPFIPQPHQILLIVMIRKFIALVSMGSST